MDTAVLNNIWPKILAVHSKIGHALPPSARQAMMALVESYAVEPRHVFHFIYVVENYNSVSLSTAHFQKRDPFDHPEVVDSFLSDCVAAGLLLSRSDGTMQITAKGERVRRQRWQILNGALAEMALLPEADLAHLIILLERVVAETAVAAQQSSAWAFQTRQQHGLRSPIARLAPLAQLIELRMDLGAYRDDAHLVTWRDKYDVSPHGWELMARIWQSDSDTLDVLSKDLARRGFSRLETAVALEDLVKLGWLAQERDNYHLTKQGCNIRQETEQQTDKNFYAPWYVLDSNDLVTVQNLLEAISLKANHYSN